MGFLTRRTGPADRDDDNCSPRYLALAKPGPRTEALALSCNLRLLASAVAAEERFGDVVTIDEMAECIRTVRQVMVQDRDLSAWVARKSVLVLNHVLRAGKTADDMSRGGVNDNILLALMALGLENRDGHSVSIKLGGGDLPPSSDCDAAIAAAGNAIAVMNAALGSPTPAERAFFADLYTGASGSDVETAAYGVTAWASVLYGRVVHTGAVKGFGPEYRDVVAMWAPGWYPNPSNTGGIVNGDAQVQRYWDGEGWTDRVRHRTGRSWAPLSLPLHDVPN